MLSLSLVGVEIIPPEPDQRSDLRREAPSVALTFPPSPRSFGGVGQIHESLTFSVLFSPNQQQLGYKQVRRACLY